MRRITLSLLIGALVLLSAARVTTASPAPAFPYKPETSWVYRHVESDGAGNVNQTGTATVLYRGTTTYRAKTYHYADLSTTLMPSIVQRDYAVWSGGVLGQAAFVISEGPETLEVVFDRPIDYTGSTQTVSGVAQFYLNAVHQGAVPWSLSTTNAGPAKVTVPAGTFMTTLHAGRFRLGDEDDVFRIYAVGPIE